MKAIILTAALWGQLAAAAPADQGQTQRTAQVRALAASLLEEALSLAEQAENPLDRAEAISVVAATLAQFEPRRALELAQSVEDCYDKATAMGEAAIEITRENEYLGLSVLGRISDRSVAYDKFAWALLFRARQSVPDAIDLASKIDNPTVRDVVQLRVTPALAAWHPRGPEAATQAAMAWVASFPFEASKSEGQAYVTAAQAKYDLPGALELAESLNPDHRDLAQRLIAAAIAESHPAQALNVASGIRSDTEYCRAVVALGRAAGDAGGDDMAELLRSAAERAEQIADARHQGEVRRDLALLLAPLDFEAALEVAEEAWPLERKLAALEGLVAVLARDDPERALGIAEDIWYEASWTKDPLQRSIGFQYAIAAFADLGADRALKALEEIDQPDIRAACLQALAVRLAPRDPETAGRIAGRIEDEFGRAETLRLAAKARAPHGWAQAERLARQVTLHGVRSKALAAIARSLLEEEGLLPSGPTFDVMR